MADKDANLFDWVTATQLAHVAKLLQEVNHSYDGMSMQRPQKGDSTFDLVHAAYEMRRLANKLSRELDMLIYRFNERGGKFD